MGQRNMMIIVAIILLVPILPSVESRNEMEPVRKDPVIVEYKMLGTFYVNGNDELIEFIEDIQGPGDGTQSDPYIIADRSFDADGWSECLKIIDVDLYFNIVNCLFTGTGTRFPNEGSSGLYFYNVSNFILRGCNFTDNPCYGAYMNDCKGSIDDSDFFNNTYIGLECLDWNVTVSNCRFNRCGTGMNSKGGNEVIECTFIDNDIGLTANNDHNIFVSRSQFESNRVGMDALYFKEISHNKFIENEEMGLTIFDYGHLISGEIIFNEFKNNNGTALSVRSHSYSISTTIAWNSILGSRIGIISSGYGVIHNNTVSACTEYSIGMVYGSNILRDNTITGTGILCTLNSFNRYLRMDIDRTTTINGLPVAYLEHEQDMVLEGNYAQVFIDQCENITIQNQYLDIKPYSMSLSYSNSITVKECHLAEIQTYHITDSYFINNNFTSPICGMDCTYVLERNNFFCYPIDIFKYWEYSTIIGLEFNDNYYGKYQLNENITSDGIHWYYPYEFFYLIDDDIRPRVFPFGYDGPRHPVLDNDTTPSSVNEGSTITFSVQARDYHMIRDMEIVFQLDDVSTRKTMNRFENYTYKLEIHVPKGSGSLSYSFIASSITSLSTNSTIKEVEIIDITSPVLVDHSLSKATTGDDFEFDIECRDDRGSVESVRVDHWFGESEKSYLVLYGDVEFKGSVRIPVDSLEPLHYYLTTYDIAGNMNRTENTTVQIIDDEKPVISIPEVIVSSIGIKTYLNGSGCSDNIGIVSFKWEFGEGFQRYTLSGEEVYHVFFIPGSYRATLTVQDERGNTATTKFRINISREPVEPDTFLLRIGPIVDNQNNYGIQGATIYLRLGDQWMINKTDLTGFTHFRLLIVKEETDVILNISRNGYDAIEHHNVILPDGKLKYLIPGLNKMVVQNDTEGAGEEEGNQPNEIQDPEDDKGGDDFPLGVFILILFMAGLVGGVVLSFVYFKRMGLEEEATH